MVRNVSKPTYFRSGHLLNSKLVSEPCKNMFLLNTILNTVNSTSGFNTYRAYVHESAVHRSVHTAFLSNKHGKIHIKLSHNFCA